MNKGDLVTQVAKVVNTKKRGPGSCGLYFLNHYQGVEKEGYGYPDWFRDL